MYHPVYIRVVRSILKINTVVEPDCLKRFGLDILMKFTVSRIIYIYELSEI